MFLEDPSELLAPAEAALSDYRPKAEELERDVESRVVEWRLSDDVFLPIHPFYRTIEIGIPWKSRGITWKTSVKHDYDRAEHGFDAGGRIVLVRQKFYNKLVLYHDDFYDIINTAEDSKTGERIACWMGGHGSNRSCMHRFLTDQDGRILAEIDITNDEQSDEDCYRSTELFHWEAGRLTESFSQSFDLGHALPHWANDLPAEEQATLYRQINDRLREFNSSRMRMCFEYGDDGMLAKADVFKEETGEHFRRAYERLNPSDTIESLSNELVAVLVKAIIKQIKAAKEPRPMRWVTLQYSAEHAHCGLPTDILIAGVGDSPSDPLRWDEYSHGAAWPPGGRYEKTIASLQGRLQTLVEDNTQYADDDAPRPYREVLWNACRQVHAELASKKRMVSEDFAVFPIDDHGDVDAKEDIRQSLPADLAERVIAQTEPSPGPAGA